jgi:hypoxanthine phosphoribosyltransferase
MRWKKENGVYFSHFFHHHKDNEHMTTEGLTTLIPAEKIAVRVAELGAEISRDLVGIVELTVVCVLKGAFIFAADLVRNLTVPCRIEFIRASSYGTHRSSSGRVMLDHHHDWHVEGKHVLLLEDILDTGLTVTRILEELRGHNPASLRVCALLDKPSARATPASAEYTGFTIPDVFVVGYGLDAAGRYRELPYVATLNA